MRFIQDVLHWTEIPHTVPRPGYEEVDALLREMKPLFAHHFDLPRYWTERWYAPFIRKLGYESSQWGDWFYDSLRAVNQILWLESHGTVRPLNEKLRWSTSYEKAARLARIYGDCYHYEGGDFYSYRLRISFWLDYGTEYERESSGYDVTAMVSSYDDTWPRIVHGLRLFPPLYD